MQTQETEIPKEPVAPGAETNREPVVNSPVARREWVLPIWAGMDFFTWMRLLIRNRFAVDSRYALLTALGTCVGAGHTALRWGQSLTLGWLADRTPIPRQPIFIIGHWRTGTTLLHELLILDQRHNFPTTYQCFEPNHFLLTEGLVRNYCKFLLPARRQIDNMPAGWDRPQEDEFALCMMGQPSPYSSIAFPNRPPQGLETLELERQPARVQRSWKQAFSRFLSRLTWKDPRRLVLKSPTHSWRIPTLLELFPDARFVHIVRDPFTVFPSTVHLWRTLYAAHGLQHPRFDGLNEQVLSTFSSLYNRLEETRGLVAPNRFHELRYEDLRADPMGQLELLYDQLELGEFDTARPKFEAFFQKNAGYKTNRYRPLPSKLRTTIADRWGEVIERYGYAEVAQPGYLDRV